MKRSKRSKHPRPSVPQKELASYLLKYAGPPAGFAIVFGYGRGHTIKQLAKRLEQRGLAWQKTDTVLAIESGSKRGEIIFDSGKGEEDGR